MFLSTKLDGKAANISRGVSTSTAAWGCRKLQDRSFSRASEEPGFPNEHEPLVRELARGRNGGSVLVKSRCSPDFETDTHTHTFSLSLSFWLGILPEVK